MYHHPEMSPSPDLATSPLTKPESLALLRPAGQTETCRRRAKHACSDRLAARQTSVPIPIQEPPSDTANSACTVYIHPRCHSPTSFLFPSIEAMPDSSSAQELDIPLLPPRLPSRYTESTDTNLYQ